MCFCLIKGLKRRARHRTPENKKSRLATWTRRDCENYNTLKDKMISYVLLLNQLDSEAATLSHVEL